MAMLDPPLLDDTDLLLLLALDEIGGASTRDAGISANLAVGSKHTALLVGRLRYLERHGLVRLLDDWKPLAWMRTAKGSAELARKLAANREVPAIASPASGIAAPSGDPKQGGGAGGKSPAGNAGTP